MLILLEYVRVQIIDHVMVSLDVKTDCEALLSEG